MGKFVLTDKGNGTFHFNLLAGNHEVIGTSEVYNSKAAALNGIDSVQTNASDLLRFEEKTAKDGRFYFNLKAANGQVILTSQMYKSESGMKNGVTSVYKNAPDAAIEEQKAEAA